MITRQSYDGHGSGVACECGNDEGVIGAQGEAQIRNLS